MKNIFIVLLISFCLFSCTQKDIIFFMDENFYETIDVVEQLSIKFKKSAAKLNLNTKVKIIVPDETEFDLTLDISESSAKIIILSPLLAKKISLYSTSNEDKNFLIVCANGESTFENVIVFKKNRDKFFENLAAEMYEEQKNGKQIGIAFFLSESRREKEKNLFIKKNQELNSGNYRIIESLIYKTDVKQTPREVSSKMIREDVDILLLFAASLNPLIIQQLPSNGQIKVITEGLYKKDQLYEDRVLFSANYDYMKSFDLFLTVISERLKNPQQAISERTIDLEVRREIILIEKEPEPVIENIEKKVVEPTKVEHSDKNETESEKKETVLQSLLNSEYFLFF